MRATATILDPCTGARGANLLLEIRRGRSAGAHVLRWCSRHGWAWVAPGSSARLASLKPRPAREPQKGTGWAAPPPTIAHRTWAVGRGAAPPTTTTYPDKLC